MSAQVMFCFLEIFLQPLDGLIGVGFHGVLHLDFQHEVGATLQVQPETDVVVEILASDRPSTWESR